MTKMTKTIRNLLPIFIVLGAVTAQQALAQEGWLPLPEGTISRIAFGSCAKHWQYQPIWERVIAAQPDLFLFLGDAIYADTDGTTAWTVTEKTLRGEWNRLADKPEFQRVRQEIPFMATWDNHDYGTHNGGAEFPLKEVSKTIFLDFFGEPEHSERRQRKGMYDAKLFGPPGQRVQIILLDTRSFKGPFKKDERSKEEKQQLNIIGNYTPNDDPSVTLLGEAQWEWLEQQLHTAAALRLIVSSTQIIPDEKGMDEWGNYPLERRKLFTLIAQTGASGVIFLSGNVHFAEISKIHEGPYPFFDFTSSGMTHINESYPKAVNSYRVAGPFVEHNVGLVEIDWEAQPAPQIRLNAIGLDELEGFEYTISLDHLQGK
ncbi:MAG: alkaline phosphatase family protein [bacterium]|nr:alkaline phosphatase family protein [bacterium]